MQQFKDFECSEITFAPGSNAVRIYRFWPSRDMSKNNIGRIVDALGGYEFVLKKFSVEKMIAKRASLHIFMKSKRHDCSLLIITDNGNKFQIDYSENYGKGHRVLETSRAKNLDRLGENVCKYLGIKGRPDIEPREADNPPPESESEPQSEEQNEPPTPTPKKRKTRSKRRTKPKHSDSIEAFLE